MSVLCARCMPLVSETPHTHPFGQPDGESGAGGQPAASRVHVMVLLDHGVKPFMEHVTRCPWPLHMCTEVRISLAPDQADSAHTCHV